MNMMNGKPIYIHRHLDGMRQQSIQLASLHPINQRCFTQINTETARIKEWMRESYLALEGLKKAKTKTKKHEEENNVTKIERKT